MRRYLVLAIACAVALPALAADEHTALTLYRADADQLFAPQGDAVSGDGYAVVHERRSFSLAAGAQDVSIGGLPSALDSEALSLRFPGNPARVTSQRLLLGQGFESAVTGLVGHKVSALGSNGQEIASGTLVRGGDALVIRDASGQSTLIRDYAALRTTDGGDFARGSTLQVHLADASAGSASARLDYPTTGMGWRGAYVATLSAGDTCRMTFDASASIANRSGRDWKDVAVKLVAGDANRAKSVSPPRVMMMARKGPMPMAMDAANAEPRQAALGDLRTFSLASATDLPDGSVTQVPLYASRTLACERKAIYDTQIRFYGNRPLLDRDIGQVSGDTHLTSTFQFKAFDALPAGVVRVLDVDRDGNAELLGEGRLDDTPKDSDATISLGQTFDLAARREQTALTVNDGERAIDEGVRIVVTNASDTRRTVTLREHPARWRAWKLTSSSTKPVKNTPEGLEFDVSVPANGTTTLNYAVRYSWAPDDVK